jgi:hypothetical protein
VRELLMDVGIRYVRNESGAVNISNPLKSIFNIKMSGVEPLHSSINSTSTPIDITFVEYSSIFSEDSHPPSIGISTRIQFDINQQKILNNHPRFNGN